MSIRATNFTESFQEGESAEQLFKGLMELLGYVVRDANFNQNCREHIDFFIQRDFTSEYSVDVKARKRIKRGAYKIGY